MGVKNILTQGGDGTAIPSNMVGEVKSVTDVTLRSQASPTNGAFYAPTTNLQLSLDAGVWDLQAIGTLAISGAWNGSNQSIYGSLRVYDVTGAAELVRANGEATYNQPNLHIAEYAAMGTVRLTQTSTIRIEFAYTDWASGGTVSSIAMRNDVRQGLLKAVRRA
jgi:hypothetical protein